MQPVYFINILIYIFYELNKLFPLWNCECNTFFAGVILTIFPFEVLSDLNQQDVFFCPSTNIYFLVLRNFVEYLLISAVINGSIASCILILWMSFLLLLLEGTITGVVCRISIIRLAWHIFRIFLSLSLSLIISHFCIPLTWMNNIWAIYHRLLSM